MSFFYWYTYYLFDRIRFLNPTTAITKQFQIVDKREKLHRFIKYYKWEYFINDFNTYLLPHWNELGHSYCSTLPKYELFAMVLLHIYKGESISDLSERYDISIPTISRTIRLLLPFICKYWVPLYYSWLDPLQIIQNTPPKYDTDELQLYLSLTIIADNTEIPIQQSAEIALQKDTSSSKLHFKLNTLKLLVLTTGNGKIIFTSKLFGGGVGEVAMWDLSDLTRKWVSLCEKSKELNIRIISVVDRGFRNLHLPPNIFIKLIPPFLVKRFQFEEWEVEEGKHVASLRYIVEVANRRIKENRIFNNVLYNTTLDVLNDVKDIAVAIANMNDK